MISKLLPKTALGKRLGSTGVDRGLAKLVSKRLGQCRLAELVRPWTYCPRRTVLLGRSVNALARRIQPSRCILAVLCGREFHRPANRLVCGSLATPCFRR
jgi:hypothetical protein